MSHPQTLSPHEEKRETNQESGVEAGVISNDYLAGFLDGLAAASGPSRLAIPNEGVGYVPPFSFRDLIPPQQDTFTSWSSSYPPNFQHTVDGEWSQTTGSSSSTNIHVNQFPAQNDSNWLGNCEWNPTLDEVADFSTELPLTSSTPPLSSLSAFAGSESAGPGPEELESFRIGRDEGPEVLAYGPATSKGEPGPVFVFDPSTFPAAAAGALVQPRVQLGAIRAFELTDEAGIDQICSLDAPQHLHDSDAPADLVCLSH